MGLISDRGAPEGEIWRTIPDWITSLFKSLMENAAFRAQFLAVYKE